MEAVLNGDINIINTIQEEIHANANIEQETKLMESMFKPVRLVFYPGGVPVVVSMSADLMCGVNGKVSGKQIVNFDVNTKISGKYGLTWSQSSKGLQRINYLQVTNELNNANVKNIGSIEVKSISVAAHFSYLLRGGGSHFRHKTLLFGFAKRRL